MAELINAIIAIGGTTAHEDPFDAAAMDANYISADGSIACFVAEDSSDLLGFQSLAHPYPDDPMPPGWSTIGTFARVGLTQRGVGSALFASTLAAARAAGMTTIDATIRADNTGGLAFYSRLGFVDYDRLIAVPLKNGTPMDRVRKRFEVR